jgi:hypothetical protein
LYTLTLGGLPEIIDNSKFRGDEILFIEADEKGTHCIIGTRSDKPKYMLFYLSLNGNNQNIVTFDKSEEITCCTIHVPTQDNPNDRIFEILFATKFGSIYHGRFYLEMKGNFKTESPVTEIASIYPKKKIHDIAMFKTGVQRCILAITDTSMYQFWGNLDESLPVLFKRWEKRNKSSNEHIIEDNSINSDSKASYDEHSHFKIGLSLHEDINETTQSVGWQALSNFYSFDFRKDKDKPFIIKNDMMTKFPYPPSKDSRHNRSVELPVK